jgi:hypothetical protein
MKKRIVIIAFLAVCASTTTLRAQWGIRYILPQTETVTQAGLGDLWLIGLGADFDLSDRTSCGVDLIFDTNWNDYGKDRRSTTTTYYGSSAYYSEKLKVYGLQYRSQFHFSDNDRTSVYVGSTLGIRYLRQTVTGDVYTNSSSNSGNYDTVIASGNGVLVPIGLRLGLRGGLEGGYADLYVGVGYALGSSGSLANAPYVDDRSEVSPLNLQIGLALGFGR